MKPVNYADENNRFLYDVRTPVSSFSFLSLFSFTLLFVSFDMKLQRNTTNDINVFQSLASCSSLFVFFFFYFPVYSPSLSPSSPLISNSEICYRRLSFFITIPFSFFLFSLPRPFSVTLPFASLDTKLRNLPPMTCRLFSLPPFLFFFSSHPRPFSFTLPFVSLDMKLGNMLVMIFTFSLLLTSFSFLPPSPRPFTFPLVSLDMKTTKNSVMEVPAACTTTPRNARRKRSNMKKNITE